ncbi:MAG TPA: hypothetical protein VFL83_08900 [Anaeromyxobacter sp.]|nr:hypothetical protein [Anaeromyxobacter sp.]
MSGRFEGAVDLGGGTIPNAGPAGTGDAYVAKYSGTSGAHVWSHGFGGAANDVATGVAVGAGGDVLVSGTFAGTVDFGGGPLASAGSTDAFLVRLTSGGSHVFSAAFGGSGDDVARHVSVGSGNEAYLTGAFSGSVASSTGEPITSAGMTDAFVAAYEPGGALRWTRGFGGAGADEGWAARRIGARVWVAGTFAGTIDVGGTALTSQGGTDGFIVALGATGGAPEATRAFGGPGLDFGYELAQTSPPLVTGCFSGGADFGAGEIASAGEADVFVASFSSGDAGYVSATTFGGTGWDCANAVERDAAGFAIVTGGFEATLDVAGVRLTSAGASDVLVARLAP